VLYSITHRTSYEYAANVSVSHHVAHLQPRVSPRQQVSDFFLEVDPKPSVQTPRLDYYGNATTNFSIAVHHRSLSVTAHSQVRVTAQNLPDAATTLPWEIVRKRCSSDTLTDDSAVGEFLFDSPLIGCSPLFADYAMQSFPRDRPVMEGVIDLTTRIFRDFKFDPRATTVSTPLSEVFKERRGVCQDFAHLAIAVLRSIGLPSRYVSGYLETRPMPGKARLIGADASHAWVSVWCPSFGWIDADPTNNLLPGDRYVTLGWGRDFSDVAPLHGVVMGGGEHTLRVGVDVVPIQES